eukprot:CAMPEP_0185810212 /NCGR_PEP_ID=MMETSP1322-20130828/6658_1 /TAXON_ID=265543 /ORGANISM="Minutocellus polymorphus, Strain RCC2270" /LENGTH=387 /DNA_ID=CAMNT_0028506519 /DNA_START=51 /DNA_END=1210 /DNA_ORIENTATION=-
MVTGNERSKKRKADEISDDEEPPDHEAPPPHLPSSCLGAILNFLPYSNVRTCMLAGRAMAVGAARHVDVLSIDRAVGMDVPALRRFPSATILKVLCLVESDGDSHNLNAGVAAKVVPLITSLPELKKVYLGGHESGQDGGLILYRQEHDEDLLSAAEWDARLLVYRTLVEALGAAYESRAISKNLKIAGISLVGQVNCGRTDGQKVCRTCSHFCRNFPLENVLELGCASGWDGILLDDICVDREEICRTIKSRPGGNDAITSKRAGLLMLDMLSEYVATNGARDLPVGNLFHKVNFHDFFGRALEDVDNMVSCGCSFSEINYSDVVRLLPCLSKPKEIRIQEEGSKLVQKFTVRMIWTSQEKIERLVKLGLPIEADWFGYEAGTVLG